jgi:triacylglycerol lipase
MRLSLKTAPLAMLLLACGGDSVSGPAPTPPPPPPPLPPAVASVKLSRDTATLVPDATVQITASALDAASQPLDRTASWSSSDETKARVANGLVTGVAPGSATITATIEGKTAQAAVTIADGGVVSTAGGVLTAKSGAVQISAPPGAVSQATPVFVRTAATPPTDPGLVPGTAYDLAPAATTFAQPVTLTLRYDVAALGNEITPASLRLFTLVGNAWQAVTGSVLDPSARTASAPVSRLGSYAIVGDLRVAVASIEISPGGGTLYAGRSLKLSPTTRDSQGRVLTDRGVTWSSSSSGIAAISSDGLVSAIAFGSATITATSEGVSSSVTISVLHDPIIFVHGFQSSGAIWGTMIGWFVSDGWPASQLYVMNYDDSQSNVTTAGQLETTVENVLASTGAAKVDIVTHSMGALSSRYFLKNLGGDSETDGWVSLAGPNHGTTIANFCGVASCVEMRPGSTFLTELNSGDETPGTPHYATWWSACDLATSPRQSVILAGATNTETACLQHDQFYADATVYQQVRDWVK